MTAMGFTRSELSIFLICNLWPLQQRAFQKMIMLGCCSVFVWYQYLLICDILGNKPLLKLSCNSSKYIQSYVYISLQYCTPSFFTLTMASSPQHGQIRQRGNFTSWRGYIYRVVLRTNVGKMVGMIYQPCCTVGNKSEEAYACCMIGEGLLYQTRLQ